MKERMTRLMSERVNEKERVMETEDSSKKEGWTKICVEHLFDSKGRNINSKTETQTERSKK